MAKNKWEKFHSQFSPIADLDKPHQGAHNLVGDWTRECGQHRMLINGVSLSEYGEEYNGFKTENDINMFFENVILKDVQLDNAQQKGECIEYLNKTFHQGGLMYPVGAALGSGLYTQNEAGKKEAWGQIRSLKDQVINVVTTPQGFKVQNIIKANEIVDMSYKPCKTVNEMGINAFLPDAGKDFVIKAQATIDVNFKTSNKEPSITVESNTISYGNSEVEKKMDTRTLGQRIVDFLVELVGLNKVKDISPEAPKKKSSLDKPVIEKEIDGPKPG